jgi:hypothetical protein
MSEAPGPLVVAGSVAVTAFANLSQDAVDELTDIFSRFVDPRDASEVFDVKIFRTRTTYQFTRRLLVRHILEHNTQAETLGNNLLLTYRINAGTVAFLGYDDR